MANNIDNLDALKFMSVSAKRGQMASNASRELPIFERSANKLAKMLHPQKQLLVIDEVIQISDGCFEYVFSPAREMGYDSLAYFSAGQYISVYVEIDGYVHSRPYSLISSPRESLSGRYAICVKQTEDAFISKYISENWHAGSIVCVSAPDGNFTYEPLRDAKHILGIAGGSGITPFLSLAKAIVEGDEDCSLTLIYGCKDRRSVLFKDELSRICDMCDKISVVYVLSDEICDGYESGFITSDIIEKYAPCGEYSVFICGPKALHEHMDNILSNKKERRYIRHELFGERISNKGSNDRIALTVISNGEEIIIEADKSESILRALERGKIPARSNCRSGECGYCRARLICGEVDIPNDSDRRRLADEKHGYIHPCCTYPKGDITIEICI